MAGLKRTIHYFFFKKKKKRKEDPENVLKIVQIFVSWPLFYKAMYDCHMI